MKKAFLFLFIFIFNFSLIFASEAEDSFDSKPDGKIGEHEYVNLGLPSGTLWATCNLGAES